MMLTTAALLSALLFAQTTSGAPCSEGSPRLLQDFSGAPNSACVRIDGGFALTISPEAEPINKSPWFAFELIGEESSTATVELRYVYGTHRYLPKIRTPSGTWAVLPEASVAVAEDKSITTLTVPVGAAGTRIAAQPVISPREHLEWSEGFAGRSVFNFRTIGVSPNGHALPHLSSGVGRETSAHVVLLGGQHPPEVPGVFAMRAFLDRLAEDDALARQFLRHVTIDAYPLLNPDGIDAGHWRLNTGLVDLNRDWGPFTQPETRLVRDDLEGLDRRTLKPALMVDFHATYKGDILYTPTGDRGEAFASFIRRWDGAINARLSEPGFQIEPRSNPGLPTSKEWFTSTFNAPGVTLEIGDETSQERAERLGRAAAEAMMETILADLQNHHSTD